MAQAIDYAAWVEKLPSDKITQIYQRYSNGGNLSEVFEHRFGTELDEENLNSSHQIILVAAELDDATERIIRYLNDRDIAINVLFFQVFQHGDTQVLSRAWYIDPGETQINATTTSKAARESKPWNGEYYVSFGGDNRSWEDARKYGFISGGGGAWYAQTLKLLSPGYRVWVKIPKKGYVGVGRVIETAQIADDFRIEVDGQQKPCFDILKIGQFYKQRGEQDPEKAEHFVRVQWTDTVPEGKAFDEVGLFGNQNTVCQPRAEKWLHTVERLKTVFKNWDKQA